MQIDKEDQQLTFPTTFYYDIQQKLSKLMHNMKGIRGIMSSSSQSSNLEEFDNHTRGKIKDRWPIPLRDMKFLNVTHQQGVATTPTILFGSTYPTFMISPEP